MSYIGLDDKPGGIEVIFYDTDPEGEWVEYHLGTLPRDKPHTIKFWMRLIPGPNDDLVRIFIDGHDVGECFTTWESSYPSHQVPIRLTACCSFPATRKAISLAFSVVATCLTT